MPLLDHEFRILPMKYINLINHSKISVKISKNPVVFGVLYHIHIIKIMKKPNGKHSMDHTNLFHIERGLFTYNEKSDTNFHKMIICSQVNWCILT